MAKSPSLEHLAQVLEQLQAGLGWLRRSYEQVTAVGIKDSYTPDEYDKFENLTSRYARVVDLLVNKVLRSLDAVELQEPGTLIDSANRAVSRGLIDSVDSLRRLKDLRNEIAHEYLTEDLADLFEEVLETTPQLLSLAERVQQYGRELL
jgi:uncharacterized protein YutE (UPF0331/DUF86 family)